MHHYSRYISCMGRRYVILLGLAYMLMHVYALYASTHHIFHGMPPMCQLCAATKSFKSSIVNTVISVFEIVKADYFYPDFTTHIDLTVIPLFQARAPPCYTPNLQY